MGESRERKMQSLGMTGHRCQGGMVLTVLVLTLAVLAQGQGNAAVERERRDLEDFSSLSYCAPFNVRVVPEVSGDEYYVLIEAERDVLDAVLTQVDENGVLWIGTSGNFTTNQTIEMTIVAPDTAIKSIRHVGANAGMYIEGGVRADEFDLTVGGGAHQLYLNSASIDYLRVDMSGLASVVVTGNISRVNVTSNAIGALHVSKVSERMDVLLSGLAAIFVDSTEDAIIRGSVTGLGRVTYSNGLCDVQSSFFHVPGFSLPICFKRAEIAVPGAQPYWTCGLSVKGNFTCENVSALELGSDGAAISPSNGGSASMSAPSEGTVEIGSKSFGTGSASASASSSGGGSVTASTTIDGFSRTVTADLDKVGDDKAEVTFYHGVALVDEETKSYTAVALSTECVANQTEWLMPVAQG